MSDNLTKKREVSIIITIDDCKDCPHHVLLRENSFRDIARTQICGVTDKNLLGVDEGFGMMYPELRIPNDCPLVEINKIKEDPEYERKRYWEETYGKYAVPAIPREVFQDSYFKCPECAAWVNEPCGCCEG